MCRMASTRSIMTLLVCFLIGGCAARSSGAGAASPSSPPAAAQLAAPLQQHWSGLDAEEYSALVKTYGSLVDDPLAATERLAQRLHPAGADLSDRGVLLTALVYWVALDFVALHDRWTGAGNRPVLRDAELEVWRRLPDRIADRTVRVGLSPGSILGRSGTAYAPGSDEVRLPSWAGRVPLDRPQNSTGDPEDFRAVLIHTLHHTVQDVLETDTSIGEVSHPVDLDLVTAV